MNPIQIALVFSLLAHNFFTEFNLKSSNNIYLVDWKDDIRPYLFISDCFILPSYREGFPNVLLQAGSMELPSIATNVPGSNEIIVNDYNGWICEPKNSIQLSEQITKVISIPISDLKEKGTQARENIKSKYEKAEYHKLLVQFYNQLISDYNNH